MEKKKINKEEEEARVTSEMARDFRSERNSLVPHGSMVQQRFASFACNLENSTALETQVGTFQLYKQAREREKESEREKCIGISR